MFGSKLKKVEKAIRKGNEKALIKMAESKDMECKLAAIEGLGQTNGDDGFNFLVMLLRNKEVKIRTKAAKALGISGNPHAKAYLKAQQKAEMDPEAKDIMEKAIAKIKEF